MGFKWSAVQIRAPRLLVPFRFWCTESQSPQEIPGGFGFGPHSYCSRPNRRSVRWDDKTIHTCDNAIQVGWRERRVDRQRQDLAACRLGLR